MSVPVKLGLIDKVRAHLELLDPVTWISVFPCLAGGVMASGAMQPTVHDYLLLLAIFLMFGPLGTGFSQSVNDYFDLELDRVNEPSRPIPSGRLTEKEALGNSIVVLLLAMGIGVFIGVHIGGVRGLVIVLSIMAALFVAYIYYFMCFGTCLFISDVYYIVYFSLTFSIIWFYYLLYCVIF